MKSLAKPSAAKCLLPLSLILFCFLSCQKETQKSFADQSQSESQSKSVPSTRKAENVSAQVAIDWYKLQLRILLQRNSSLGGASFGYLGIGLYESVRYGIKNSVSLSTQLYQMPEMPARENNNGYDWQVSANAAMASLLRSFNTGLTTANNASIDSLEKAYNDRLKSEDDLTSFERSQTFGRSIATAVRNWSLTDNTNSSNAGYQVPPPGNGAWEPTPPAYTPIPINPFASSARLFLQSNLSDIAPAPIPYSEVPNSTFYNMVKNVYDVSKTVTLNPEAQNIALFWVDQGNGIGYTPAGHDFSIITQALEKTEASLAVAAEVYAKAGIAERDAGTICFTSKYIYNLLRPVTYIQRFIDPKWLPFITTPNHPEYPAAHAFITGSVMQAATEVLGENLAITDHTYDFRDWTPRSYSSLFKAGEEAGMSRLYGGIHYLPSINMGLSLAHNLGSRVGDIKLHD
jgi:hypothetical protein